MHFWPYARFFVVQSGWEAWPNGKHAYVCACLVAGRRYRDDVATSQDAPQTLAEVALSRSTAAADQYVQFAKSSDGLGDPCFDYSYPQLDAVAADTTPYPLPSLPVAATPPPRPAFLRPAPNVTDQPSQRLLSRNAHCVYCQQMYDVADNAVGSCRHAPDPLTAVVDFLTCGTCARLTLGRCCRVVDPEEEAHPCSGELDATCGRWAALTALSVVVPCLCCYWPLTACGNGAARCGWYSGRRHRPIWSTVETLWRPLFRMDTAVKHPVPDLLKTSFVIFDIRAVPGCQKLQMTAWPGLVTAREVCLVTTNNDIFNADVHYFTTKNVRVSSRSSNTI